MTITFSSKDPGETLFYGIDFAALLGEGETIGSTTVTLRSSSGASQAAMLSGAASIDGSIVKQKITGGAAGMTYILGITIVTSAGQTLIEGGEILVAEKD